MRWTSKADTHGKRVPWKIYSIEIRSGRDCQNKPGEINLLKQAWQQMCSYKLNPQDLRDQKLISFTKSADLN